MEFSRELLFFFSALGAFNGLVLGFYFLLYSKPKHISNYFLGTLLLTLSIRIGKSVFFYFNPDLSFVFLQIGLTGCFFIGPSLYFYLKSVTGAEEEVRRTWKYHFVALTIIALIVGIMYPFEEFVELWRCYIISGIYYQWLGYLTLASFPMKKVYKDFRRRADKMNNVEIWILSVYIGNVMIWCAYFFCSYTSYILGALSFSFILYLLILLFIFNKKKDAILFKKTIKYGDKKIEASEAALLIKQLKQLMIKEALYRKSNLKLHDVSKKLNILPHRLSQLINDNLGSTFPNFVNEYRIQEAKKLIQTHANFSLEAIGYECGFNSKSTFYAMFKKYTGTTPAKYKSSIAQID